MKCGHYGDPEQKFFQNTTNLKGVNLAEDFCYHFGYHLSLTIRNIFAMTQHKINIPYVQVANVTAIQNVMCSLVC